MIIKSAQNKTVKQLSALKQKKERDKSSLFVLEGERLVNEIPPDWEVIYYAVSNSRIEKTDIAKLKKRGEVFIIDEKIFLKICDTVNSQGIIAVCRQKKFDINAIIKNKNIFLVMLEKINDPGNLGSVIRTADAAGCDCVVLSEGCADLYNPKTIRSTMGSVFHIPIVTNVNLNFIIDKLKAQGIKIYAAHLSGKSLYKADLGSSAAVLIGNEANGLSDEISEKADMLIKIPMIGKAESINAAAAAAVIIYECLRQRLV